MKSEVLRNIGHSLKKVDDKLNNVLPDMPPSLRLGVEMLQGVFFMKGITDIAEGKYKLAALEIGWAVTSFTLERIEDRRRQKLWLKRLGELHELGDIYFASRNANEPPNIS